MRSRGVGSKKNCEDVVSVKWRKWWWHGEVLKADGIRNLGCIFRRTCWEWKNQVVNADWPLLAKFFRIRALLAFFFEQFQLVNLLFSTYWKEKWRLFSGSIWFVFLNYNDGWIHRMPLWSPFQLLSWPGSWKMHVWSNLIPRWHGRLASSLLVGHWYGYVHRQEVLQLIETSCVWMSIYLKSIQPSNRPR